MYFNLLKKDFKHKKTMNIILLCFFVLTSMLVSSSVSNILTVMSGTDYYFDKAGMSDFVVTTVDKNGENPAERILKNNTDVKELKSEEMFFISSNNIFIDGKNSGTFRNVSLMMSIDDAKLNYFDNDNNVITSVDSGKVYIGGTAIKDNNLETGDKIEIRLDNSSMTFEVAGICKDALLGSDMMGNTRFVLNDADYKKLSDGEMLGDIWYINTDNANAVESVLTDVDGVQFSGAKSVIKMTYIMDMVVAGVLLAVSVCLILIAFAVLRFTINFTLSESFREIGVMKAIGIKNRKIRGLYMIKYLGMSAVGAFVGCIFSIPLGDAMIKSISEKMVLGNSNGVIINFASSVAVMAIILLFCYMCTGKVRKFSPLDAIRSGQTGERFKKKSKLCIEKSRLKPCGFMALNDILSSPARFVTLIITFTLCLSLLLTLAVTASTLQSPKLLPLFATTESDAYYADTSGQLSIIKSKDSEAVNKKLSEIEETLSENGMPAKCHLEVMYKYSVEFNKKYLKTACMQGIGGTKASEYVYTEGTPPESPYEIAVTKQVSEKLGAKIGDKVEITRGQQTDQFLITAYFQSMNNLGELIRFNEKLKNKISNASAMVDYQIDFTDDPDEKQIAERIDKMKKIFSTDEIRNAGEFSASCTGVGDTINSLVVITLAITGIIIVLVTVLTERSFIAKEQGDIALMKALGFKSLVVIKIHTYRMAIASIAAWIFAAALTPLMTKYAITPIFSMMGADSINFDYNPVYVFTVYPLITAVITILSTIITAQYTRKIKSNDISNIE